MVAFVAWPPEEPDGRALVRSLSARGAHVVAVVSPDHKDNALAAADEGADDIFLTPGTLHGFAVRALLAAHSAARRRAAPWFRPRSVLHEALAHATGGEVIVRGRAGAIRVLVSHGRIAWVHDDADRGALLERLRTCGVNVTAEELASVVAECQATGQHLTEVMAQWGIAEAQAVRDATRAILDGRLKRALSEEDCAALFIPSQWRETPRLGFTSEELGVSRATVPPRGQALRRVPGPVPSAEQVARVDAVVREVLTIDGCVAAAGLHYGAAAIVSWAGDAERLTLAWTLGAALDELADSGADVLACSANCCHLARSIPAERDCFVYGAFDLSGTSVALARRSLAVVIRGAPRSAA